MLETFESLLTLSLTTLIKYIGKSCRPTSKIYPDAVYFSYLHSYHPGSSHRLYLPRYCNSLSVSFPCFCLCLPSFPPYYTAAKAILKHKSDHTPSLLMAAPTLLPIAHDLPDTLPILLFLEHPKHTPAICLCTCCSTWVSLPPESH